MDLTVSRDGDRWQARFNRQIWRCAVGRGAVRRDKREGDGATPAGCWPLRRVLYRADRLATPQSRLPLGAIGPQDAWCDDLSDPDYNRQVILPFTGRSERLWREDEIYDIVVVLGYNDDPPLPGAGSAIFLHVARADFTPTEGCVALALNDLLLLLDRAGPDCRACVQAG